MDATSDRHRRDPVQAARDRQLERLGWGLFLVMLGGLAVVPDRWVPADTWLVGTGLIMLGLNAVRYLTGLPMSPFTLVLGLVALGAGLSAVAGVDLPVIPIIVIAIGAHLIAQAVRERSGPPAPV